MRLSIRACARELNISDTSLRKLIASGRVVPNADGTMDLERARAEYAANARPKVDRPARQGRVPRARATGTMSYSEARAARERLALKREQMAYDVARGKLIDVDEAKATAYNDARRARDRLLLAPDRVAHSLVGLADAADAHRIVEQEIFSVCDELSGLPPDERRG